MVTLRKIRSNPVANSLTWLGPGRPLGSTARETVSRCLRLLEFMGTAGPSLRLDLSRGSSVNEPGLRPLIGRILKEVC